MFVAFDNPISEESMRLRMLTSLAGAPGAAALVTRHGRAALERVVVIGTRSLVVFPHAGGFRLAWRLRAAVPAPHGLGGGPPVLLPGVIFLDAITGERLYEGVTASDAETPDVGHGLSNLPFGGSPTNRTLQIVRVNASNTYRLRDTTHSREIITYDWAGALADYMETGNLLTDGSVPVSSDTDGDKNWNDVAADASLPALTASQQTEVDSHFNVQQVYEWYNALAGGGGREGFDDDNYGSQVPDDMPVHLLAHVAVGNAQFYMLPNDSSEEVSYISFGDQEMTTVIERGPPRLSSYVTSISTASRHTASAIPRPDSPTASTTGRVPCPKVSRMCSAGCFRTSGMRGQICRLKG